MSLRNLGLFSALLVALSLLAPVAYAQEQCCTPLEPDYYGWDQSPSGGFQPPTTTTCQAFDSSNQRCRTCVEVLSPTGVPLGYKACGYVAQSASCYCESENSPSCRPKGSCTYYAL
jgi:hypothetical protein